MKSGFPEQGLIDWHCFLNLTDPLDEYVGGQLTSNTITSRKDLGTETDRRDILNRLLPRFGYGKEGLGAKRPDGRNRSLTSPLAARSVWMASLPAYAMAGDDVIRNSAPQLVEIVQQHRDMDGVLLSG